MLHTRIQRILWRVRLIYVVRRLLSPFLIKWYGIFLVGLGLASTVSLGNVLLNVSYDGLGGVYGFFSHAFFGTELLVQVGSVALFLLVLWMSWDFISLFGFGVHKQQQEAV